MIREFPALFARKGDENECAERGNGLLVSLPPFLTVPLSSIFLNMFYPYLLSQQLFLYL